jgi:hypothetical protein
MVVVAAVRQDHRRRQPQCREEQDPMHSSSQNVSNDQAKIRTAQASPFMRLAKLKALPVPE